MPTLTRAQAKHQNQPYDMSTNNINGIASASLFTPLSAPVLRSVDPAEVAKFLKQRERYELKIKSKQSEIPSLKVLPNIASIDHELLDNVFFMGTFEQIAPNIEVNELTDEYIETFIKSIIGKTDVLYDPAVIDKALKKAFQCLCKLTTWMHGLHRSVPNF